MPAPNPGKPEKNELPVEVVDGEQVTPQPAKEVELDAATGQPVQAPKPAESSVSAEEFRKLQARYEYQARQFERSQREFQDQLSQMRIPQPVKSPTEKPSEDDVYGLNKDELNQLGQSDWTKPVRMMAEKIADKRFDERIKTYEAEREKQNQERNRQQTTTNILEREKQWVLEQNPSLNDESSEDFRGFYGTYNRMLQEDPTLLQNPRAPRLVYREWKAEDSSAVKPKQVNLEEERLKRVAGGVSPQGRPSPAQKTIKLTQEEVDLCKEKGFSPAVYASIKEANLKEGVSA